MPGAKTLLKSNPATWCSQDIVSGIISITLHLIVSIWGLLIHSSCWTGGWFSWHGWHATQILSQGGTRLRCLIRYQHILGIGNILRHSHFSSLNTLLLKINSIFSKSKQLSASCHTCLSQQLALLHKRSDLHIHTHLGNIHCQPAWFSSLLPHRQALINSKVAFPNFSVFCSYYFL